MRKCPGACLHRSSMRVRVGYHDVDFELELSELLESRQRDGRLVRPISSPKEDENTPQDAGARWAGIASPQKTGSQKDVLRTEERPTSRRHEAIIATFDLSIEVLVEKYVGVVGSVSEVVDHDDGIDGSTHEGLECPVEAVVVDHEAIKTLWLLRHGCAPEVGFLALAPFTSRWRQRADFEPRVHRHLREVSGQKSTEEDDGMSCRVQRLRERVASDQMSSAHRRRGVHPQRNSHPLPHMRASLPIEHRGCPTTSPRRI